jgi:site-specific recombinase XerD
VEIQILARKFYEYSLHMRGYTPATIKRYRYVINSFCRFSGITFIEEVTNDNVRALFFNGRTQKQWKTNTFIVFYKSLTVFFNWCIREGYLQSNPIAGIEKPKIEQKLPSKLTKQDALQLLEIVNNYPFEHSFLKRRNHAIFSMFIFSGLRLRELLNLRLTDIDLQNMTVFVNQGKGSKDRIIPLIPSLNDTLKLYLHERQRMNKTCPEFFVSFRRNCGFTESGMKNLVTKMCSVSELKFTVHKLRHTFATLMLEGGCDIYSLSRMMGHSDIKTTTIYLYATTEHLRSQIAKHPLS